MTTATVGEIQKNFSEVLKKIRGGQEVVVTRRGKPVARIVGLGPGSEIDWPDFYEEALPLDGEPLGDVVREERDDRL
ncbi:MAG: type II toxin-antitoxin system prevent-host-death family antitoxin [Polyangia bacterium]